MRKTAVKPRPWAWVPSLYFIEGLPYILVMSVSVLMYKRLGIGNDDIALYTSWLYLPWVIKPLWSPFLELFRTKRFWIVVMQFTLGAGLAGVALTLPGDNFFRYSLAFFWLVAFSSATHDIAADGFYMLGLRDDQQAFFVGIRSTFYRLAMIGAEGGLVVLAGLLEEGYGIRTAWLVAMGVGALVLLLGGAYHAAVLPHPAADTPKQGGNPFADYGRVFVEFFKKPHILALLAFFLFYRIGEAQLVKIAGPFLIDERVDGGLYLDTEVVGIIKGTVGLIALVAGGILGGIVASKHGLKAWLWPMVIALNVPNLGYVYLAAVQPDNVWITGSVVALENFGYGFGFQAFVLYLIYVSRGKFETAHYAIGTGLMALGMMLPGMVSGKLQLMMGYTHFFAWVVGCGLLSFLVTALIPLDADFGKKKDG